MPKAHRPVFSTQFEQDLRRLQEQGFNLKALTTLMELLIQKKKLPKKYCDHALRGSWIGARDAHVEPDWVLIYRYADSNVIHFERTGTHAELFD